MPGTTIKRYPIRGAIWGILLGLGVFLLLTVAWPVIGLDSTSSVATKAVVFAVVFAALGALWGMYAPPKKPKGAPPTSIASAADEPPPAPADAAPPPLADEPPPAPDDAAPPPPADEPPPAPADAAPPPLADEPPPAPDGDAVDAALSDALDEVQEAMGDVRPDRDGDDQA